MVQLTRCVLVTTLLLPVVGAAQSGTAEPAAKPRNIVRLDLAGFIFWNGYQLSGTHPNAPLLWPVLLGYERQVGHQASLAAEVLLHGGDGSEHTTGLSVQGRYYPPLAGCGGALFGGYLAPTLSYRAITQTVDSNTGTYSVHSRLGGTGLLLGVQIPLGRPGRLVLDTAIGYVAWKRFWDDSRYPSDGETYREIDWAVPDGRLSFGYRF